MSGNSCNPDYGIYEIGTRTQWNPVPLLDIGFELLYTGPITAYKGRGHCTPSMRRGRPSPDRRSGCVVDDVPLAAQLLSVIGDWT